MGYPQIISLFIDGQAVDQSEDYLDVSNPADDQTIGRVCVADKALLERAVDAAGRSFAVWSATSPLERSALIRKAAALLRNRVDLIARLMTQEQGKPLRESRTETLAAAEILEWFAEEARRTYGRIIPARVQGVSQLAERIAVGPVAAFTPWNFPLSQMVRKIGPALAAGCSIIVKGPEEAPASPRQLVQAFHDAGLPRGVLNLVFGHPAEISSYLIAHPVIRKISFTGSTPVGKHLASLAGAHMKRVTMELGGHGPALVFSDGDVEAAVIALASVKFRNAGQVCVAPTRFIVHEQVVEQFIEGMVTAAKRLKISDGLDDECGMGPLANARRVIAMEEMVADALSKGAVLHCGGQRLGNSGNFYEPTVLSNMSPGMRAMEEEPFGPLALITTFRTPEEALAEANRLPYGLAAYAWTASATTMDLVQSRIRCGMLTINHLGLGLAETPFGGTCDSGYGSEGGTEAMDGYLETRFISRRA